MASRSNLSQEDPPWRTEKRGYSDLPSVLHQKVDHAGDGGGEKYPGKLIPVKERKTEERRGVTRVDSREEEPDGGKEEKPVPARAALPAAGVGHGEIIDPDGAPVSQGEATP